MSIIYAIIANKIEDATSAIQVNIRGSHYPLTTLDVYH